MLAMLEYLAVAVAVFGWMIARLLAKSDRAGMVVNIIGLMMLCGALLLVWAVEHNQRAGVGFGAGDTTFSRISESM